MRAMPALELLSAQQVADRLGVAEKTVRRWIESGKLSADRQGGAFGIRIEDAEEVFVRSPVGRAARRVNEQNDDLAGRLRAAESALDELRGRYRETQERLVRLEAELAEERRRSARLELQLELAAA